jgi:flagellar protein FliO/FliZ
MIPAGNPWYRGQNKVFGMIWDILSYLLLFIVLGGGGFIGYVFLRSHLNGGAVPGSFFGPKPDKRIDVVEQWTLDARRRLVLIRRDDVEHLIMTGGPVDVVIETGISAGGADLRRKSPDVTEKPVTFARPARPFGTAPAAAKPQAVGANGGGSPD